MPDADEPEEKFLLLESNVCKRSERAEDYDSDRADREEQIAWSRAHNCMTQRWGCIACVFFLLLVLAASKLWTLQHIFSVDLVPLTSMQQDWQSGCTTPCSANPLRLLTEGDSGRPVLVVKIPVTYLHGSGAASTQILNTLLKAHRAVVSNILQLDQSTAIHIGFACDGTHQLPCTNTSFGDAFSIIAEITEPPPEVSLQIATPTFFMDFIQDLKQRAKLPDFVKFGHLQIFETSTRNPRGHFKSWGYGSVCRRGQWDQTYDDYAQARIKVGKTVRQCSEQCDNLGMTCYGFEYRDSEQRCELWMEPICDHRLAPSEIQPNDFQCFIKCT